MLQDQPLERIPPVRKLTLLLAVLAVAVPAVTVSAIAAGRTRTTTLQDDFFTKSKLTIKKNTTVIWKWNTDDEHTVTEYNGRWGSKGEKTKATFKHKFKKKGKFTVYCLVHPVEMRQRIVVK
jgi:plastocyanin